MSHESDNGIVGRIVKAVKRHPCLCTLAGACVAMVLCGVYMKSGAKNVVVCKEAVMKKERVVIGAKVVKISNNADVEAINLGTESRIDAELDEPKGPQNSKEEKKRKERERWKKILAALAAGGAAGIKIMSMMPTPDPNENNRLPDKIPNIPTPQEKWFKWLWETREMRFEYRPLEFVRAYADKYPGYRRSWLTTLYYIQANFSKTRYYYSKDMKNLSTYIATLTALAAGNVYAPEASIPTSDNKRQAAKGGCGGGLRSLFFGGTAKKPRLYENPQLPEAFDHPSDASSETEVLVERENLCQGVVDHEMQRMKLHGLLHEYQQSCMINLDNSILKSKYGILPNSTFVMWNMGTTELNQAMIALCAAETGVHLCLIDHEYNVALLKTQNQAIFISTCGRNHVQESIQRLHFALVTVQSDKNTELESGIKLICNKNQITDDVPTLISTIPGNNLQNSIAEHKSANEVALEMKITTLESTNVALQARIAELEAAVSKAQSHHNHPHANGSATGATATCKACGK